MTRSLGEARRKWARSSLHAVELAVLVVCFALVGCASAPPPLPPPHAIAATKAAPDKVVCNWLAHDSEQIDQSMRAANARIEGERSRNQMLTYFSGFSRH